MISRCIWKAKTENPLRFRWWPMLCSEVLYPRRRFPRLDWLPLAFSGKVHGQWGFEPFDGPVYKFQHSDASAKWMIPDDDKTRSIAGHDRTLHLHSENAVCVEETNFRGAKGEVKKTEWKTSGE